MLAGNAEEFNKQVRSSAIALLVRRSIRGLLFLSLIILNFRAAPEHRFGWRFLIFPLLAIVCFTLSGLGCKSELKRLKPLK
jgi:hypothetical protein